ncbi:MAG: T9SS type A sorting domain-containing protein [Bacteroidetes bacterium]|nr:T9SS type A sorting domain-containing protein [Bacteroidota bacterium]
MKSYSALSLPILFLILLLSSSAQSQPIVSIGSVSTCAGNQVSVPINVNGFLNIGAVTLEMSYDTSKVTYLNFTNAALTGNLIVNSTSPSGQLLGKVLVSWFSLSASNLGSGLLMNLNFQVPGSATFSSTPIEFNLTTPGQCELADANGDVIPNTVFNNGSINRVVGATITNQPSSSLTVSSGGNITLPVSATGSGLSYQWEVLSTGSTSWQSVSGSIYSGETTSSLSITGASAAINNYQYRLRINTGCSTPTYAGPYILTVQQQGAELRLVGSSGCTGDTISVAVRLGATLNAVDSISLQVSYNAQNVQFAGLSQLRSVLSSTNATTNAPGNLVIRWSGAPATLDSGLLMNLRFVLSSASNINWNLSAPGTCYLRGGGSALQASYQSGSVGYNGATITQQPQGNSNLAPGQSTSLSVGALGQSGYRWQSRNTGGTWTNLTDGVQYSGTGTSNLNILNAALLLNGTEYRAGVLQSSCSDTLFTQSRTLVVQNPSITLGTMAACPGDTIEVQVNSTVVPNVGSFEFDIDFNPQNLRFLGVNGFSSQIAPINIVANTPGRIRAGFTSVIPISLVPETLFRLRFIGRNTSSISFASTSEVADTAGTPLIVQLVNGTFTANTPHAELGLPDTTYLCAPSLGSLTQQNIVPGQVYTWFRDGVQLTGQSNSTLAVTIPGMYRLHIGPFSGCAGTSDSVRVLQASTPAASFTPSGDTTYCQNRPVTLSAASVTGLTYQWLRNDTAIAGATSSSYQVALSGSYKVRVTNAQGCTATSTAAIHTLRPAPGANITLTGPATICSSDSVLLSANQGAGFVYQWIRNDTAIVGATTRTLVANTSGRYRVRVSTNQGCFDTSAVQQINVLPAPTAVLTINGSPNVCAGRTVVLTTISAPGQSYQWFRNDTLIGGAISNLYPAGQAGLYKVRVTNSYGCFDFSDTLRINILNAPGAPFVTVSVGSDSLFSTASSGNIWFRNGVQIQGVAGRAIRVTQNGVHYAIVRGTNGCFSDTSNRINITNVSLENLDEVTFMVYPNPTSGKVFAQVSGRADDQLELRVRNVVGQVVRQESIRTEQGIARVEWEMSAFPSGVYFVQLENKGRLLRTEKLILRKP